MKSFIANIKKGFKNSPNTTLAGIAGFGVIVLTQLGLQWDDDPNTKASVQTILMAGWILLSNLLSRDNNTTSEDALR